MPSSGAERLKAKKNRIRPWQAPPDASQIAAEVESVREESAQKSSETFTSNAPSSGFDGPIARGKVIEAISSNSGSSLDAGHDAPDAFLTRSHAELSPSTALLESDEPAQNQRFSRTSVGINKGAIDKQLGSNSGATAKLDPDLRPIREQLESNKGADLIDPSHQFSIEEQLRSKDSSNVSPKEKSKAHSELGSNRGAEPLSASFTSVGEQLGSKKSDRFDFDSNSSSPSSDSNAESIRKAIEEQLGSKYSASILSTSNTLLNSPIGEQLGSKNLDAGNSSDKGAIEEQKRSEKPKFEKQLRSKAAPQLGELESNKGANRGATREQLGSTARSFYEVTGKEREFLIFTFQQIIHSGTDRTLPLSTDALRATFDLTSARLTNIVKRLCAKGVLLVHKGQRGKGGWRVFGLPQNIYQDIRQSTSLSDPIKEQLGSNRGAYKGATKGAEPSSSSSLSNSSLNEDTTKTEESVWVSIPESLKGLVSVAQMRNLVKSGAVDEATLEDSLFGFAHDLANNLVRSKTGNPIGLLVGAIKNGGYISQHYLANKKAELLEIQKRNAELKQVRDDYENEKLNVEFEKFQAEFPEKFEELKSTLSFMKNFDAGSPGYKVLLQKFKDSRSGGSQASI